jgi:hypothetical protein
MPQRRLHSKAGMEGTAQAVLASTPMSITGSWSGAVLLQTEALQANGWAGAQGK